VTELAPPAVQTHLMPGHATRPDYQPLGAFADDVMSLFTQQPTPRETLVQRVRMFRFAEAENRFDRKEAPQYYPPVPRP
jgi:uncharacterized oxidoreductase